MNKLRRGQLKKIIELLRTANELLGDVLSDEQNAFDNLLDGLQQSQRGADMEDNIDIIDDALDDIEEVLSSLNTIT